MSAKPPIIFDVTAWLADTAALPADACGAWINILCQLHLANPQGEKTLRTAEWARVIHTTTPEARRILTLLGTTETAHVTFCHTKVTVMSRRMVRERKSREAATLRQQRSRESAASRSCHSLACARAGDNGITATAKAHSNDKDEQQDVAVQQQQGVAPEGVVCSCSAETAAKALKDWPGTNAAAAKMLLVACGVKERAAFALVDHFGPLRARAVVAVAVKRKPVKLAGFIRTALEKEWTL